MSSRSIGAARLNGKPFGGARSIAFSTVSGILVVRDE